MNFKHIILMRFNLRMPGYEASSDPDWLNRRCDMFENTMLRSLEGQTNQNFVCCPLLDEEKIPSEEFRRIRDWRSDILTPMFLAPRWAVDGVMYDKPALLPICQYTASVIMDGTEDHLITTRMDSDDAIHKRFIEVIQEEARPNTLEFLNFPDGWAMKDDRLYVDAGRRNMFITLVEPVTDKPVNTVHCVWHKKAMEFAPIRQVGAGERFWLRGIHKENRSSKIRGHNRAEPTLPLSALKDTFTI